MNLKKRIARNFPVNIARTFLKWAKYKPLSRSPYGHYYSPIISKVELDEFEEQIWKEDEKDTILGVNLNLDKQLLLLKEFSKYYSDLPFENENSDKHRYYFNNGSYEHTDAIMLYSFMRHFQPKNIIEIGSGFSSSLMLDTRDIYKMDINIQFIEPYPDLLFSLFRDNDSKKCKVRDTKVQNVSLKEFRKLKANDILFIDSSHVSKTGSDVNFEIFEILPNLNPGVLIHFHDMFYPFEYPKEWVFAGRNWNEDYLLRAFLSYNNAYEIMLFSHYIHEHHKKAFKTMPLTFKNTGGNLWIRKK